MYPFPRVNARKSRQSKVDALERNPSGRRTIIRNDFTSSNATVTQGGAAAARVQSVPAQSTKRSQKGRIKSSTVAIYASVFVLLVAIIAVGYRAPQQVSATTPVIANVANESADQPAVDTVLATRIASSVAEYAGIPVTGNVRELADSTEIMSQYSNAAADNSSVSKPAIVALSNASRNIVQYVVVEGDSIASIAAKFGVSEQTIKWANDISGNSITVGSTIDILPRDGLAYVVKSGDTVEGIARKYKANVSLIVSANDLEVSGLSTGLKIIIPDGELPTNERPGYIAPAVRYSSGFITGVGTWSGQVISMGIFRGVNANDGGYANGNCTAWAFYRRAQMGMPIPTNLGNANTWATKARAQGLVVNSTPSVGAVIQAGMHVGVVEEVYANGNLRISDMNYGYRVYNLAYRIIPAASVKNYAFIH